ncbi:CAP domain-containing protein [Mucilaginibacter glaciei]|uniref:CAP domain-containing protein n=1 Tax=Mucilaginibacter glaciei TaxID=2772109 RepID=A0A926NI75_9SPHI|nr:CAP domain-containing protein [Mucilaginibacter glaciei]MBD1391716.1 CAP domain-containing protein [Mucilaginibacter glaciei]
MRKIFLAIAVIAILIITAGFSYQPASHSSFKNQFLELINRTREKGCTCGNTYMPPVAPVVWNDNLQQSAEGHAKDMARQEYFSHTSKDGRTMETRIVTSGYKFKGFKSFMIGENIAFGQNDIAEVMAGWFRSEGHCKNLMNPGFKEVGVAEINKYWVQDFGGRESFSAEQQRLIKAGKYRLIQQDPITSH